MTHPQSNAAIFLIITLLGVQSCKNNKSQNLNLRLIDTNINEKRIQGAYIDEKKVGPWTYFTNQGLDSIIFYDKDGIMTYKEYFFCGRSFQTNTKVQKYITDAILFAQKNELRQSLSSIESGRKIFFTNCLQCHYIKKGTDFYSMYKWDYTTVVTNIKRNKLNINNFDTLDISTTDTQRHFIYHFFSDSDISSLIIFLNSDKYIKSYID